ncbi:MAG TPA: potassium-transporting ATPase subunit KdpC [Candidatus Polarisedimenticolaceae bacterium]
MLRELGLGLRFTLITLVLLGGGYPLVVWAVGRVLFPAQAEGSLILRDDGTVVGSRLIAQGFTRPQYFHPRPSAVDYDAASAGGTNYAASNPEHLAAVRGRLEAFGSVPVPVPAELVTASGSGLDPHLSPAAIELQVPRVAAARGTTPDRVREIVRAHTEGPTLGFLGRPRVNVLELNLDLDRTLDR